MIKITIKANKTHHYPVYIGYGIGKSTGRLMDGELQKRPCLLVSDTNVAQLYGAPFLRSLQQEGFAPRLEVLKEGEQSKTLDSAEMLYGKALQAGLDRQSSIIALGGGIMGDLAGFVASTYLRGIPYVQIPTSLLAMVDSSVGGKVAVNHPLGKNMIGSFYHPALVVSDISFLETLPPREWRAGMAEVIKYGVIGDANLFAHLETLSQKELQRPRGKKLLYIIARAVQSKGRVVVLDEKEQDYRRILNYGHTFGHALEAATGFNYYLHGEAVAVGMQMAALLAHRLKILDFNTTRRITELVKKLDPPAAPADLTVDAVAKALFYDKKKKGQNLVFVLPEAVGRVGCHDAVPGYLIEETISSCLHQ